MRVPSGPTAAVTGRLAEVAGMRCCSAETAASPGRSALPALRGNEMPSPARVCSGGLPADIQGWVHTQLPQRAGVVRYQRFSVRRLARRRRLGVCRSQHARRADR
jgi:hypothetical protein